MEIKGFVLRESVEHDARLKKVVLTEKGVQSHEMLENLIENLDMSLAKGITDEELSVFYSVVRKLTENLSKQDANMNVIRESADDAGNKEGNNREEEINDPDFIE